MICAECGQELDPAVAVGSPTGRRHPDCVPREAVQRVVLVDVQLPFWAIFSLVSQVFFAGLLLGLPLALAWLFLARAFSQ